MNNEKEDSKSNWWLWILIPLGIVLITIIFVITFKKVDFFDKIDNEEEESNDCIVDEEEEHLNKLQKRHKKLQYIISQKEALSKKLSKNFRWTYFAVRFLLVTLYLGYNAFLFFIIDIRSLGDLLNWNEVTLIIIALFYFLVFGSLEGLKGSIRNTKLQIEIIVYDKYIEINKDLLKHKEEKKTTSSLIDEKSKKLGI